VTAAPRTDSLLGLNGKEQRRHSAIKAFKTGVIKTAFQPE
jgi:hypothetical protein